LPFITQLSDNSAPSDCEGKKTTTDAKASERGKKDKTTERGEEKRDE